MSKPALAGPLSPHPVGWSGGPMPLPGLEQAEWQQLWNCPDSIPAGRALGGRWVAAVELPVAPPVCLCEGCKAYPRTGSQGRPHPVTGLVTAALQTGPGACRERS